MDKEFIIMALEAGLDCANEYLIDIHLGHCGDVTPEEMSLRLLQINLTQGAIREMIDALNGVGEYAPKENGNEL